MEVSTMRTIEKANLNVGATPLTMNQFSQATARTFGTTRMVR